MLLTLLTLYAQAAPIGEAWVSLESPADRRAALALGAGFAEGREGAWVRVHGDAETLDALAARFEVRDRTSDHRVAPPTPESLYHTPKEMADALTALADAHPDRAQLMQIGESVEGRPILALRMGNPEGPSWRVVGTHHGDELSSAELALVTAEALLDGDPRMPPGFLNVAEVWVVPHVNPDGVANGSRYNARDVDINRNYGFEWSADEPRSGGGPFSEPEPRAVRAMSLLEPFHAGLSLHSGAQNIGYVWNYTEDDTVEEDRLAALGLTYEAACEVESFYTVNGADWYITRGDTNDWSYGMRATLDYTVEISTSKAPDEADLGPYLQAHLPAVGAFLATPVYFQAVVVDAETGDPVDALITVVDAVDPFPTDFAGRAERIVDPDRYTLRIEAPGYQTAELALTVGESDGPVTLSLTPDGLTALTPEPALLSRSESVVDLALDLDPLPDFITLWRSGADPITVDLNADRYPVPTADLLPGFYTLLWDGGAAPRAVFAGNPTDRVAVETVSLDDGVLTLSGQGFAVGALGWALTGTRRVLRALPVLSVADDEVRLDVSDLDADDPVDVLLATNGAEVAVVDALGDPQVDDAPEDTGYGSFDTAAPADEALDSDVLLQPACGCMTRTGGLPSALLLLSALLAPRRRP